MSINRSFGVKLSVLSFDLPINLVKESDNLLVSITTMPEQHKQELAVSAKKMKNPYLHFKFNVKLPSEDLPKDFITTGTEKIIIIFRKKSFFKSDQIVAYSVIPIKELPNDLSEPTKVKTIEVYRKNDFDMKNNNYNQIKKSNDKRIVGKMDVKLLLREQYQLKEMDDDQLLDFEDNSFNNKFSFGKKSLGFSKL